MLSRGFARAIGALGAVALVTLALEGQGQETATETANEDRIALLVTAWGPPKGFSPDYRKTQFSRAIIGDRTNYAGEPCTEWHYGTFPYRSEFGRMPFAVAYKVEGFEHLWDRAGIYRLSEDGETYVALHDEEIRLTVEEVGDATITPVKDLPSQRPSRSVFFHPDPRDGTDYLARIFKIDLPNGIHDMKETSLAGSLRSAQMMGYDLEAEPEVPKMMADMDSYIVDYIDEHFGDVVDTRFGRYGAIPGLTRTLEEVAANFARDGFKKFMVARETTDHNSVVSEVWSLHHTLKGLCQAGLPYGEEDIDLERVRQVGRTPEYNEMLMRNLRKYLENIPEQSEVSIIYATHGQPWPGPNPDAGPLSRGWHRVKDVTHENAFLNYLSFRRYAEANFDVNHGGKYQLNFSRSDGVGGPESRSHSLFAGAMLSKAGTGHPDDPHRMASVRSALESAIRLDGKDEIIILLSHWYGNNMDTGVIIREINDLPLNSIEQMGDGIFSVTWCERYTGPGTYEQVRVKDGDCPDDHARIQLTEAFDEVAEEFFNSYVQRIRGGIERFGVFPNLGIEVAAQGPVTKLDGGTVEVTQGPLAGTALFVRPDPRPNEPESYEWADAFRPASSPNPNTGPDAIRAVNDFQKIDDYLDSAKDDFTAFIGTQEKSDPGTDMPGHPNAISAVVYFGPYRTLFNAPATVTLPYDRASVNDPSKITAHIFNETTKEFDPVYAVPAGEPIRVNEMAATASFDVQVLGNFVLVLAEEAD